MASFAKKASFSVSDSLPLHSIKVKAERLLHNFREDNKLRLIYTSLEKITNFLANKIKIERSKAQLSPEMRLKTC